jgi:hypothetical protein
MFGAYRRVAQAALAAIYISTASTTVDKTFAARDQPQEVATVAQSAVTIESDHVKYEIGANGRSLHFIDKATGADYCDAKAGFSFAHIRIGQAEHSASSVSRDGERIRLEFGAAGVTAVIKPIVHRNYLVFEVVSLEGKGVECFTFVDVPLTLKGQSDEPFVACPLALNLRTNVIEFPQPVSRIRAMCHPRFGFTGAQAAVIACPKGKLREIMKEAVTDAPDLPHSNIGGPWAMDSPANRGSYMFNFGGMSEATVDDWIKVAKTVGINQIDFHGGSSFRFGDCRPNPQTYPKGYASLKAVVDRLHAAGIKAGLHTYAFFMAKDCPWVTPVPDRRLAKASTFTLAGPLSADAGTVPVAETTAGVSTITGFFVRNSVTLHIDDELITFSGVSKEPPFAFTGCRRGACGTKTAAHIAGAKVHHLKECFGLFVPDADSTLLEEVAAKTAEAYNECGFDMMYLDALDGEDILGGGENAWHYGSKFVFEIFRRVKKPPIMEMSTFHHHLWYVRARMGAWDHPSRSHKRFIDIHCQANEELRRMFLPGHLGWWAVKTWSGPQDDPTYADDIEYLCGKCIGHDVGFSVMGIDPSTIKTVPAYERLAGIMRQYEGLRHANYFDESVKSRLREPGKEFALVREADGRWRFRRVQYAKHKVEGVNGWGNVWSASNPFAGQPLRARIEVLMSAGPYDAPTNATLTDFADPNQFSNRAAAPGVKFAFKTTSDRVKAGTSSGVLTASNEARINPKAAWAKVGRTFVPPIDLSKQRGLGVWIHGDGAGEVLNFQLTCPPHVVAGIGDHYVTVDFTGWRYFELIEPEGERYAEYSWPYGDPYSIYREHVSYADVATLSLWYNNVAAGGSVTCNVSPIKALPLVTAKIRNPAISVGGKKLVFPVEMESGCYLEFDAPSDCRLYGPKGAVICEVQPQGDVPVIQRGANQVTFTCDGPAGANPRVNVTVICRGDAI